MSVVLVGVQMTGLTDEQLEELSELLFDIKHDLGKYITFEVRFVGMDAQSTELRKALFADLWETDKRGAQCQPAWTVWQRLRPPLLHEDPDAQHITAILDGLSTADLEPMTHAELVVVAEKAKDIQRRCVSMWSRCMAEMERRGL